MPKNRPTDIIVTGVGGQGVVLTSKIIAQAGILAGLEVRTSETIGMAQREGSVNSHVRLGEHLFSSLVPTGQADVLLSLELAETIRGLGWLQEKGVILINDYCVVPSTVALGQSVYQREQIKQYLASTGHKVYYIPACQLAEQAGNIKTANVVMLGALSVLRQLGVTGARLAEGLAEVIPPKLLAINRQAFILGRQLMQQYAEQQIAAVNEEETLR